MRTKLTQALCHGPERTYSLICMVECDTGVRVGGLLHEHGSTAWLSNGPGFPVDNPGVAVGVFCADFDLVFTARLPAKLA